LREPSAWSAPKTAFDTKTLHPITEEK